MNESDLIHEVKDVLESVLQKKTSLQHGQHKVIFGMQAGSLAFNLAVATSDKDYFGVYLPNIESVLSLISPPETFDQHEPDLIIYEIAKYCKLLAKGNPKVIEPLFAEHLCFGSEEWEKLKELRKLALNQQTVKQYVSYALGKVNDIKKGVGQVNKNFYHAIRLLQEAKRMIEDQPPKVWMDGEDREYLLSIRRGDHSEDKLMEQVNDLHRHVEERIHALPKEIDLHVFSDTIVDIRMQQVKGIPPLIPANSHGQRVRKQAEDLLQKLGVSGEILCVIPSGARLYGLSDTHNDAVADYIGIYVAPIREVISLYPPPIRVDDVDGRDPKQKFLFAKGFMLLEVHHACELISGGNFRLFETLFYDHSFADANNNNNNNSNNNNSNNTIIQDEDVYETESWLKLKQMRNSLLTQQFAIQCSGVVQGKLVGVYKEPSKEEEAKKTLAHAVRLLTESERVLRDHHLQVVLNGDELALFKSILQGTMSREDALKLISDKKQSISDLMKTSKLSKKADREQLSQWLISVRMTR